MIRLFVGIALPPDLRQRLTVVSSGLPRARWITPENRHITLRFIGEVAEHVVDDIHLALSAIAGPAFDFSVSGVDLFGHGHRAHTLWARVSAEPALLALQAKIEQALMRIGLEAERRKFTPHITLARIKGVQAPKLASWLEANGGLTAAPVTVTAFTLFRSRLGSGGAYYEALSDYPLEAQ